MLHACDRESGNGRQRLYYCTSQLRVCLVMRRCCVWVMQRRWSLRWIVLLLLGHFSIELCRCQEPTTNDKDEEPSERKLDSILNHIHFSDDTEVEDDVSETEEKISDDEEGLPQSVDQGQCINRGTHHLFRKVVLGKLYDFTSLDEYCHEESVGNQTDETSPVKSDYQRPVCKKGEGCDIPLSCYDFVTNGHHDIVPDPPQAVELTPLQLQNLLGNGTYKNCCALVMFYAPWCEYSVNFAQKFNAIGRTFVNLPVIAVDLSAHDPHKFVLAYLPVVAFYHWGKVIYKFDLKDTYEEMKEQLVKMTEFEAREVDIEEEDNLHPVPIEREKADRFYLRLAVGWLIFVVLVTILRTKPVVDFALYLRSRFRGPPAVEVDNVEVEENETDEPDTDEQ